MLTLKELTSRHSGCGIVEWIGIRPERRGKVIQLEQVNILSSGLEGDHYSGTGKRAVTLMQKEHLGVISELLKQPVVDPAKLRRNILISGINLLALKNSTFQIGNAVFQGTGICAPCSRMEETFGHGGYNAVRGHGGITAQVLQYGELKTGDKLLPMKNA